MRSDVNKRDGNRNRPQKPRDKRRTEAGNRNDCAVVIAIRVHIQQVREAGGVGYRVDHVAIPTLGEVWD